MMRNWQPYAPEGACAADVADLYGTLTPAPMVRWQHLQRIREAWPGPMVVKGLMHPDDAREAVALGVDGLVISNHGGRQLDAAPAPLDVLPAIRAAVGDEVELILDSGVRRGSDIVVARCLGARFALFGRPTLFGVAAAGEAGAQRVIQIVRSEIDMVLAQIGCGAFDALGPAWLWPGGGDAALHQEVQHVKHRAPTPLASPASGANVA
jgi:L-lactate dehydrogenase (cytochrome)/(S)-mandelate dehydrogenase